MFNWWKKAISYLKKELTVPQGKHYMSNAQPTRRYTPLGLVIPNIYANMDLYKKKTAQNDPFDPFDYVPEVMENVFTFLEERYQPRITSIPAIDALARSTAFTIASICFEGAFTALIDSIRDKYDSRELDTKDPEILEKLDMKDPVIQGLIKNPEFNEHLLQTLTPKVNEALLGLTKKIDDDKSLKGKVRKKAGGPFSNHK